MNITATGQCGAIDGVWIIGQQGAPTPCGVTPTAAAATMAGSASTSKEGWALYDDNGNYVGQRGW
jgi:hypothetical protein